jgi:hypothetical protein
VILEAWTIGGGMPKDQVVNKANEFWNRWCQCVSRHRCHLEQIQNDYAPFSIGVHYMAHHMNLVVQTLSILPLVKCIESLLQTLHAYFAHSPKRHLEFTKLAKIMETKGNKILCNVKIWWISMLSVAKIIMAKYITLLLKKAMNNNTNQQVKINFEHLYDHEIVFNLHMHFALARICAWFNQVCSNVGHICLWPGGNCQGLQMWFIQHVLWLDLKVCYW